MRIGRCFYINLDRRPDRKEFIEGELSKIKELDGKVERFSAIDGSTVNPRDVKGGLLTPNAINDILSSNVSAWGLSMTQGGLGVLLSYLELFEIISKESDPCVLFEDDIVIHEDYGDQLTKVISELPEDFDYCYMGYGEKEIKTEPFSDNVSKPIGMITCLPSIIVSPEGAKKLLGEIYGVDNQIDTVLYTRSDRFNVFVSNKKVALVKNDFKTDIQGDINLVKNYNTQNYIFTTLSVGDLSNTHSLKLCTDLSYFNQEIVVITDKPEMYEKLSNVKTVLYPNKRFSYNDKILCFRESFKISDAVVYIDSDCRIFYDDYKKTYSNFLRVIPPGYHSSWVWGSLTRKDSGFFTSDDLVERVDGYGELALKLSEEMGIDIDNSFHHQEGIIIISKEDGKEEILLNTWEKLSIELDKHEIDNNSEKIGRGEGNLIGLSISKSEMTVHGPEMANRIGDDLKYNFLQCSTDYIKQYPTRKTVNVGDGEHITSKKYDVIFKDKVIDLKYDIYRLSENLYELKFQWNKNNQMEFIDHIFKIGDIEYKFNSIKDESFHFTHSNDLKIHHTYDWYGETNWETIDEL